MKRQEKIISTRILAEISIFVSLSTALSFIKIYTFPQGGSVTAGSMVPIIWLALRRGPSAGLFSATVYGIVQLIVQPYVYQPIQVLLDYPLAFGFLGIAGFFQKKPFVGMFLGISGRFLMHFISGVVFFGTFAPEGMHPFLYSAIYNGSYLIPEMVISGVIIYTLKKSNVLEIYL